MGVFRSGLATFSAAMLTSCATVPRGSGIETERAAVMAADQAFDRDTNTGGIEAWISWFELTATLWNKQELQHGREVYRTTLGPLLAVPGTHLRWQPDWADVSGDMAYSTGRWQLHRTAPGAPSLDVVVATGHYATVWRRQNDGGWKAAFDIGNDDK